MPAAKLERRPMSEREYLALDTNRVAEFTDGFLEFLTSPDEAHCEINYWIVLAVRLALARAGDGVVKQCLFRLKISSENYREPDTCVLLDRNSPFRGRYYWSHADIVFEVVSASHPERDYEQKRIDYASAGVPENWIIDPRVRRITLLKLENGAYVEVGVFSDGHQARSFVLPELLLDVRECFDAGNSAAGNREPLSEME